MEALRTELEEYYSKKYEDSMETLTSERNEIVEAAEASVKAAEKAYKELLTR